METAKTKMYHSKSSRSGNESKIKTLKPLITQENDKRISMALAKDIVNGLIKV